MYHSVSEAPSASARALSVRPAVFGAQLGSLRREGFTGLTFGELGRRRRTGEPLPARPIVLTFDDGYADLIEEALPKLIEHGFPATVFVTTGWLRDAGRRAAGTAPGRMLSWAQLATLSAAGIEVAAHSHSHPQLDQISGTRLRADLGDCKQLLEDRLGRPFAASPTRTGTPASGYGPLRGKSAIYRRPPSQTQQPQRLPTRFGCPASPSVGQPPRPHSLRR